jgi:hypothetical protein
MEVKCLYDKLVNLKDLVAHPLNRNSHPKEQIQRLAKILSYQGFRYPIKISKRSGYITSGHGRVLAAKYNKWKQVPVNYQEYESEEQEYADVQADNAIASWAELSLDEIKVDLKGLPELDFELLGIEDFNLEEQKEGLTDDDVVPEIEKNKFGVIEGQIWVLGAHRLMCGDSTNKKHVEILMDGEKADMVFTDPPYGMSAVSKSGVLSKKYKTDIMGDGDTNVAKKCFELVQSLAVPKLVFWGANYYSSSLPDATCWLVWDKNNGGSDQMDCELAWTNFNGVTRQFTKSSEKQNRVHPTQKPVELVTWCLDRWEAKDVVDLFLGSGSTLIACEKTNRKCYGMELDPHYCSVIIERWQNFTGKTAELLDT